MGSVRMRTLATVVSAGKGGPRTWRTVDWHRAWSSRRSSRWRGLSPPRRKPRPGNSPGASPIPPDRWWSAPSSLARNADTGFQRSATTNDTGDFIITLLPPGRYTVSAERQGFKKAVRENIDVLVGTRQTVALELAIGTISEAVTVSVATPLIETTRSDLGGVVTAKEITEAADC